MMFGWILLIIIAFYLWDRGNSHHDHNNINHDHDAIELLKKRYANGEIGSEEFNERKRILEQ